MHPTFDHINESIAMPRRRSGLNIREIDGEAVVYDVAHHAVHYLNETALLVWRRSDGKTSLNELATSLQDAADDRQDKVEQYLRAAVDTMVEHGLVDLVLEHVTPCS